jgi:hypothetical protein
MVANIEPKLTQSRQLCYLSLLSWFGAKCDAVSL